MNDKQTEALAAHNSERLDALVKSGQEIDPLMLLKVRLDLLTDTLLSALDFPPEKFEEAWLIYLTPLLDELEDSIPQEAPDERETE